MTDDSPRISLKRAYDAPEPADGCRVLVDRMWPRGVRKDALRLDDWVRDIAPSSDLRGWFGHDPAKWDGFRERYFAELDAHAEAVDGLRRRARAGTLTLVFAAGDTAHNNAVALKEYLERDR